MLEVTVSMLQHTMVTKQEKKPSKLIHAIDAMHIAVPSCKPHRFKNESAQDTSVKGQLPDNIQISYVYCLYNGNSTTSCLATHKLMRTEASQLLY